MTRSNWFYDEMRQTGLNFENADQVASYDANQGNNFSSAALEFH